MSSPNVALLAGLVGGFNKAQEEHAHTELASRAQSREAMMTYLGQMAANQNIPPEHQQWALGKLQELAQADVTKKLPKVDLGELPPASVKQPPRQAVTQVPGISLQQPTPPSQPGGPTSAQPSVSGQSGTVGRDSSGKVNALGAGGGGGIQMPTPPLGTVPGGYQAPPVNIPPGPPTIVQNPQPPIQIAPGGGPHVLTASDRLTMANAAQQEEMNMLQQRFPDKTPEQLAYFAKHDEFPKPEAYTLGPGQERFEGGKLVAENKEAKPGAKTGYKYDKDTGGIVDLSHGGVMTTEEVAADPKARNVLEQAATQSANKEAKALAKEVRGQTFRIAMQGRSQEFQVRMLEAREEALTNTNKTMVEAAPKVIGLSDKVREDMKAVENGPLAGRWQELWAGKIGADDPDFIRLKTDAKLLTSQLQRMHVGQRGGMEIYRGFQDMVNVGKQSKDNLNSALDAIDSYAKDVKESGVTAKAAVSTKARGGQIQTPSAPSASNSSAIAAHPDTHQFSIGAWKSANPSGNTEAAKAAAKAAGYEVVP